MLYLYVRFVWEIIKNRYLVALAAALAVVVIVSFFLPPAARAFARFFAYLAVGCNVIPAPTTPVLIYMGRAHPWYAVALVGATATTLANFIDYEVFTTFLGTALLQKIRNHRHSQASIAAFRRVAFPALLLTNVVVFSWDLVRLVAIAARYPRWKYALATFGGRTVRYSVLAYLGEVFDPPLWAIGVIAILVAAPAAFSWLK